MRYQLFTKIAGWAERRPWRVLGLALAVTALATALASRLELNMQFKNMMPQSHPTVEEYDHIIEHYSTASSLIVAATGEEQALKSFADELAPALRRMTRFIGRVDYRINREFIARHGFMLMKAGDLENTADQFGDLGLLPFLSNLNDAFEKTYVADGESISNADKEDKAVRSLDGIETWLSTMQAYLDGTQRSDAAGNAVDQLLIGDPYFISQDKDMLLLFAQPTFTLNDMVMTVEAVNAVDSLIAVVAADYPGLDAGTTGTMALGRDEMEAVSSDMFITTFIAFFLIIGLFIVSFRMWAAPLLAGISLIIGVIWAAGFAEITVGSLNMMTSMFAVILVGLGIDYNIHVISGYTEFRAEGNSIGESLRLTLVKTGGGIVIGSITTAFAFLTMLVSDNLGMKEFAIVAGAGVFFCMMASLFVLPSLLVVRDRIKGRRPNKVVSLRSITWTSAGRMAEYLAARPLPALLALGVVTTLLLLSALSITFDYNYLNMEPKGLKSIELQDEMIDEFDVTPDMVLITASSVERARSITEEAKELKSTGMVTSISDFVPSDGERDARIPYIEKIRSDLSKTGAASTLYEEDADRLIDELYRLEDNVIELAQLAYAGGQDKVDRKTRGIVGDLERDAKERQSMVAEIVARFNGDRSAGTARLLQFQDDYVPLLRKTAMGMTSVEPITVADLPVDIRNQFVSDDGTQFLVSIYPSEQVWDFEFLTRFTEQMHRIDPRVTGLPSIFSVLIELIARDGTTAAILALTVIFLLLWIDYRSATAAAIAMVALATGAVWMVGLMNLFGMQFNMVNVMGIPLILGIGIDDAVHILNRYRVEGSSRLSIVFASTGKAVALTSFTTMAAFGSLGFAVYRGLGSLGLTLFIGVGTALLATLFILPPLFGLLSRVGWQMSGSPDANPEKSSVQKTKVPKVDRTVLFLLALLAASGTVMAQETDEETLAIVRAIDENERSESSRSVARQIIVTSSGSERVLEMESYSKGRNEKMLNVYTEPARIRGDKILMLNDGDDIWFFTPKTDRVRHLASHAKRQRVQGSDFSYEDMASGDLEEDYTHSLLGEEETGGTPCYKIESLPTDSGPSYSKIIVWAEKQRYVTRRIDYYDEGELLKRLVLTDIRQIDGHWIPFRMTMENLRDGGKTVIEIVEMEINVELEDRLFTTNNLRRR